MFADAYRVLHEVSWEELRWEELCLRSASNPPYPICRDNVNKEKEGWNRETKNEDEADRSEKP